MTDTTHEAPERIWACSSRNTKSGVVTLLGDATFPVDGWWEYVRIDLVQAVEQRGYANAMEAERKLHEDRIEALTAKLAKAVLALEEIAGNGNAAGRNPQLMAEIARATLAAVTETHKIKEGNQDGK